MKEPEVLIIYTPTDGQAHMFGARRVDNAWRYSGPSLMPAADLPGFINWRIKVGMQCMDVRKEADKHTPGMSAATPVLLWRRGVTAKQAADAMAQLHTAILNLPDEN